MKRLAILCTHYSAKISVGTIKENWVVLPYEPWVG